MEDTHGPARRALVIGASGGIGGALAAALEARGDQVVRLSRSVDGFDITDPGAVRDGLERLEGSFSTVLIATGILAPTGFRPEKSLSDIDAATMAQVMALNAIGPALILARLPRLLPRTERSVVGLLSARVGSIGDNRLGGWYSYRASKAAANQVLKSAAIEFHRTHPATSLVALHPGTVETEFTRNYPSHAKVTPQEAAINLLNVLDGISPDQSGSFVDWAGKAIPW